LGSPWTPGGDQLAIDDAGLRWQPENSRSDPREAAGQIAAIPAVHRRGEARLVKLHPPAVKLQFKQPAFAGGRR
jgi:hypothetical protein